MRKRRLVAAVGASALCVTALMAQDALTALGVRPDQAKVTLFEVLGTGRLYQEAAKTAFLTTSAPVFALPMGVLFLSEKLTARVLLGTAVPIAGIWLVLLEPIATRCSPVD